MEFPPELKLTNSIIQNMFLAFPVFQNKTIILCMLMKGSICISDVSQRHSVRAGISLKSIYRPGLAVTGQNYSLNLAPTFLLNPVCSGMSHYAIFGYSYIAMNQFYLHTQFFFFVAGQDLVPESKGEGASRPQEARGHCRQGEARRSALSRGCHGRARAPAGSRATSG